MHTDDRNQINNFCCFVEIKYDKWSELMKKMQQLYTYNTYIYCKSLENVSWNIVAIYKG